jgi:hypothetical protein
LAALLTGGAWLLIAAVASVLAGFGSSSSASLGATTAPGQAPPSALALSEIPREYLDLYLAAGRAYGIDWALLAAIGKVECDHGRDPAPSCTHEGAVNGAGAGGPMQFLASTWAVYGVDGNGDGVADRWDPADAVYSAANYLRASGAATDARRALLAYNPAGWYADEVETWARHYRGAVAQAGPEAPAGLAERTRTPVGYVAGERAVLAPGDGHVALVPRQVPAVVAAMIVAGNELQDLPYGPGGHPDPRGAAEEDCSSSVNYVLYRAGVRPIEEILSRNPLAQDYVGWGAPGPGRWVTIYATDIPTPHVFVVIAGLRLDTSHNGTDIGPNRYEDGPRWRMLDHIPTWAHWSVRHPAGL